MKRIDIKILVLTCIVCLLPIILGLVFYNELPEKVAIHFDINNKPDNYWNKEAFIFVMPIMMVVIQLFACIISDLNDKNKEANKKAIRMYKWIIPIITVVLYIVTLLYALNYNIDIRKIAMIILGIMYIVSGNYIPKTKGQNIVKFKFIKDNKLPEKEIEKIKRNIGYIFIINGIMFIISIFFKPIVSILVLLILIIAVLGLEIYGYIRAQKEKSNK